MITRKTLWVPITLSLALSACTTTRQEQDVKLLTQTEIQAPSSPLAEVPEAKVQEVTIQETPPATPKVETVANTEATEANNKDSIDQNAKEMAQLQQRLERNDAEIARLTQLVANNNSQLTSLNSQLDQRDERIVQLTQENQSKETQLLLQLEAERKSRGELERRYALLTLENEDLLARLNLLNQQQLALKNQLVENQSLESQQTPVKEAVSPNSSLADNPEPSIEPTPVETDSNITQLEQDYAQSLQEYASLEQEFSQLTIRHADLTKRYTELDNQYQQLDQNHQQLMSDNLALKKSHYRLQQQNTTLTGTIAAAQAQHQGLWDRISVQDKVIASLEAEQVMLRNRQMPSRLENSIPETVDTNENKTKSIDDNSGTPVAPLVAANAVQVSRPSVELATEDDSEIQALAEENNILISKISRLEAQVQAQQAQLIEYRSQLNALEETQADRLQANRLQANNVAVIEVQNKSVPSDDSQSSGIQDSGLDGSDKQSNDTQKIQDDTQLQLAKLQRQLEALAATNKAVTMQLAGVQAKLAQQQAIETQLADNLAKLMDQKAEIQNELVTSQTQADALLLELVDMRAAKNKLNDELAAAVADNAKINAQRSALEQQVNNLIPFEAEVNALEAQLSSALTNVQWQRPKAMPLNNAFEIVVTAEVENPLAGQVFVAELLASNSLDLLSAPAAEAVVTNGQLQWRWRVTGLSEQQAAQVDLFVNQQMQYREQRLSRQVYRDQTKISLTNDSLWDKYGFWGLAILAGLAGGFMVGRVSRNKTVA